MQKSLSASFKWRNEGVLEVERPPPTNQKRSKLVRIIALTSLIEIRLSGEKVILKPGKFARIPFSLACTMKNSSGNPLIEAAT